MLILDHLFIFLIAIVYPIAAVVSYRKLKARIAKGDKVERTEMYNSTMIGHWCLFAVAMILWGYSGRAWSDLGFGLHLDASFAVAVLLALAGGVALYGQRRHFLGAGKEGRDKFREQVGELDLFLPRNGNELGRFYGLSLTAGIVEEVLWRGFMIWYLSMFMPIWAAAVVSSIGFGVAHAYQGVRNMPQITLVGGVFALLFVLSGSLWLPMAMHAAVDMFQGRLAYDIVSKSDDNPRPSNDTPAALSA